MLYYRKINSKYETEAKLNETEYEMLEYIPGSRVVYGAQFQKNIFYKNVLTNKSYPSTYSYHILCLLSTLSIM